MSSVTTTKGSARFAPRRLGHVNLWVSDLERSIRFYQEVCGIELVRRERAIKIAFHSNGNTHHDIGIIEISRGVDRVGRDGKVQIPATRGLSVGLNHLGWEMENEAELVSAYQRAGGSQANPPLRTVDHLISHSVYVNDPDGNGHEFYADALHEWRTIYNLDQEDEVTGAWDPDQQAPNTTAFYNEDPPLRTVASAPLHPGKMVGATFATTHLAAMEDFCVNVAGLRPRRASQAGKSAVFAGALGRADLRLLEVSAGTATGLHSFAFDLLAPVDVPVLSRACEQWHLPAPRQVNFDAVSATELVDPDGFLIHFIHP